MALQWDSVVKGVGGLVVAFGLTACDVPNAGNYDAPGNGGIPERPRISIPGEVINKPVLSAEQACRERTNYNIIDRSCLGNEIRKGVGWWDAYREISPLIR
jgi:hypothetical protein